jgi:head-tail adaptor
MRIPNSTLTDRVTVEAVTRADDGAGGMSETWAAESINAPCRIVSRGSALRMTEGQTESKYTHDFYFQRGSGIAFGVNRLKRGTIVYAIEAVFLEAGYDKVRVWEIQ